MLDNVWEQALALSTRRWWCSARLVLPFNTFTAASKGRDLSALSRKSPLVAEHSSSPGFTSYDESVETVGLMSFLGSAATLYGRIPDSHISTKRSTHAVHEDDRPCFDFRGSQACQDAIAGRFPSSTGEADRAYQLSEGIHLFQRRHNDLVHEANQALYRVQQSWHALSEAYAALFSGEATS